MVRIPAPCEVWHRSWVTERGSHALKPEEVQRAKGILGRYYQEEAAEMIGRMRKEPSFRMRTAGAEYWIETDVPVSHPLN